MTSLHNHPAANYTLHRISRPFQPIYSAATVSELVAFVFRDQLRAPEVLNELRRRDYTWGKDLDEAVAVTLNADGKARVQLSIDISTYEGAGWAKLWGSLLTSTLFLTGTKVLVEATDGLAVSNGKALELTQTMNGESPESGWWREALARSANFKRDVAALMEPSGSAIFMLLRNADAPMVLKQLRNYGDTFVHTSLSSEQDKKMLTLLSLSKENRS